MRQPPYAATKHSKLGTDWESLQLTLHSTVSISCGTKLLVTRQFFWMPWPITCGLGAAASRLPAQPLLCLHHPSLGPPECLSARSPLISFMDVVNHSTHCGAEEKPDLLDLPAWFFQSKISTLNDFLWFFFLFVLFRRLNEIPRKPPFKEINKNKKQSVHFTLRSLKEFYHWEMDCHSSEGNHRDGHLSIRQTREWVWMNGGGEWRRFKQQMWRQTTEEEVLAFPKWQLGFVPTRVPRLTHKTADPREFTSCPSSCSEGNGVPVEYHVEPENKGREKRVPGNREHSFCQAERTRLQKAKRKVRHHHQL